MTNKSRYIFIIFVNRWKFGYDSIIKTQIRPERDQYKWENIKLFTKTRRDYTNILKKKLKSVKLTEKEIEAEQVISKRIKEINNITYL